MTAQGHDRIRELVDEGRGLLLRSRFREAADVFGRILLLDAGNAEAREGLESARRSTAEAERQLDASLDEARLAIDSGALERGRRLLEAIVDQGGNRDTALSLLDRLDRRQGRLFGDAPPPLEPGATERTRPGAGPGWSRRALVVGWCGAFALVSAGVASSWERLVLGLVEPPVPAQLAGPPVTEAPAPSVGERAVAEARRLAEAGDAAGALAVLDDISPDEPAYPFARQFRAQVESAVRRGGRAR